MHKSVLTKGLGGAVYDTPKRNLCNVFCRLRNAKGPCRLSCPSKDEKEQNMKKTQPYQFKILTKNGLGDESRPAKKGWSGGSREKSDCGGRGRGW